MNLDTAREMLEKSIRFVANTGLRVAELRRGHVRCVMPFAGNENHIGTMYAGALFTLAEMPGGALFLASFDTRRYVPVVRSLDLRFLKPARGDVSVEVTLDEASIGALTAQADAEGKAEFELEGQLKTDDGTVVAVSHGVYQIRARPG